MTMSPSKTQDLRRTWKLRSVDPAQVESLARDADIPPILAQVLVGRGVTDNEEAGRFLAPKLTHLIAPDEMAGLDDAATRLLRALQEDEPVAIFGDYDVDGISSTALVGDYLRRAGAEARLRVAHRAEGYGFGLPQAEEMASMGCPVLLLLDCGTSDHEAVALATSRGVDVLVVDHHQVTRGDWPGHTLVNPQRQDCAFPYKDMTTVGLAFHLMARLRRLLQEAGRPAPDPRACLDLVALGTIADVAPLQGVNRVLVSTGLSYLTRTSRPGLRELMRLCDLDGKEPRSEDVAWRLSPRLNAPGRLGDASVSLECLYQADITTGQEAARRCHHLNEERRDLQEKIMEEALLQGREQVEEDGASFVMVASESWHPGVLGIVAARLAETFGRPAAALCIDGDESRASARSVPGVDLVELLTRCADRLVRYGGHTAAAGFSVHPDQVDGLRRELSEHAQPLLEDREITLELDGELDLDLLDIPMCEQLNRLEPFGEGNPAPMFVASGVKVDSAQVVGRGHLLLRVRKGRRGLRAIGFGMGHLMDGLPDVVDVAFHASIDTYREPRVQLKLEDLRPHGGGES